MDSSETESGEIKKLCDISPVQKQILLAFISIMSYIDFTGYLLPNTLYPELALEKGFSSSWSGVVIALFPLGGIFASFTAGKIMRFYKKSRLLLVFLLLDCLTKFLFGVVDFIDDPTLFIAVSMISRLLNGLNFMAFQTIILSFIPEAWPDPTTIVEKLSYFDFFANCGLLSGPLLGSLISYFLDFFSVFALLSALHLAVGLLGLYAIRDIPMEIFVESKSSLDPKKMLSNLNLVLQFLFEALFTGSVTFVSSGFETYIINDLGSTQAMCSLIYSFCMMGFCISLIFVSKIYKPDSSRKSYFLFGCVSLLICNQFVGPNPLLGITSVTGKLISESVSFFIIGFSEGAFSIVLVPEYKLLLRDIFIEAPEELLTDMASGIYLAGYCLAEFLQAFVGGFVIDAVGWEWASVVFSGILLGYSIIYWGNQIHLKIGYRRMVDEGDKE